MSDLGHRAPDITGHPDMAEMRERYAKVAAGGEAMAIDGLVLLTGLYAAISPWVVHFRATNPDVAINNLVIGVALIAIGLSLTMAGDRMYRLSWTCGVIGVWMIISPWVVTIGHSPSARLIWNNVLIGGVLCALALGAVGMMMGNARPRRSSR
jgi:hypothetical protein